MREGFDGHNSADLIGLVKPLAAAPQGVAKIVNPNASPNALAIQYQVLDGVIYLHFGLPVEWIGLTPDEAGGMIAALEGCVRYARTVHVPAGAGE
jgi:hypothetical protein